MRDFFVPRDMLLYGSQAAMPEDFSVRGFPAGQSEAMGTLTVTVSSSGVQPWTPAEITTSLWLDAADTATITFTSGLVSQWTDKSGNNRHATQGSSGYRPKIDVVELNGIAIPYGDGTQRFLSLPAFTMAAGVELFFVVRQLKTGATLNGDICTFSSYSTYQGHFGGGPDNAVKQDWYSTFFSSSRVLLSSDNVPPADYMCSVAQTGSSVVGRVNGVQVGSAAATFNGSPSMRQVCGNSGYYVGAPVYGMHGYAEYVLVQSPSADLQQKIEGYLAHKWGLSANLPSGHPYKSAAPTV